MKKKTKLFLFILIVCAFLIISAIIYILGNRFDKPTIVHDKPNVESKDAYNYIIDFETLDYISNQSNISKEKALSGVKSGYVKGRNQYSPAIVIPIPSNDSTEVDDVNVKFWLNPSTEKINAILVFSILDQNNNQVLWEGYPIVGENFAADNWYTFNKEFILPDKFVNSSFSVKIYLWNKDDSGAIIFIDDVSVSFKESTEIENPRTRLIDFESSTDKKLSSKYAKSGFYSTYVKGKDDFSATITIPLSELNTNNLSDISFSFNYLSETKDLNAVFVVSVCDKDHKDVLWYGVDLSKASFSPKNWETANGNVIVNEDVLTKGDYIKIYMWNRNDNQVFIDDVYLVMKEKRVSADSIQTAYNMMSFPDYQVKTNHPPYNFTYLFKKNITSSKDFSTNNIFTKNPKVLVGSFSTNTNYEQLLTVKSDASYLLSFENLNLKAEKVSFSPAIPQNTTLFADESKVYVFDPATSSIKIYSYHNSGEFVSSYDVPVSKVNSIENIVNVNGKDFSVIEDSGSITTFTLENGKYKQSASSKPISPDNNNLKTFKASFFEKNKTDLLCIYLEDTKCKYVFLEYNPDSKNWKFSGRHSNKSLQSFDQLDFMSDYFVVDYNKDGVAELMQFSRSKRFSLRLVSFDLMTYKIMYNIDFKGFNEKQNPKYYEVTRIVSANLVGDKCSEVVIFQDNINKVNWLPQKTEMYSFGN
jgi:hypothetical protein